MNIENMVKNCMELLNFSKKEPLGFAGSMNFYGYCEGDPVNFVDVTGLKHKRIKKSFKQMNYIEKVARYILQKIICRSIKDNIEYGGIFSKFKNYNDYNYPEYKFFPRKGKSNESIDFSPEPSNYTYLNLALFHTHGKWDSSYVNNNYDGNENFSNEDIQVSKSWNIPIFLGSPLGRMASYFYDKKTGNSIEIDYPKLDIKCSCK